MSNDDLTQAGSGDLRAIATSPEWLMVVRSQIESLKFGTVQITVHDSKVVQIERIEKTRLDRPH